MTFLITEPSPRGREDLAAYRTRGGYAGLDRVRAEGGRWALEQVAAAGLRGRGGSGSGCPLAAKWRRMAASAASDRYVVANGAESQAVSQKDRYLLTHFPHRVLEGLLIAAEAVGARQAFLCVRGDSGAAVEAARRALAEAETAGLIGTVAVAVQPTVPTAVSGEETALLDALAGLEGYPQPQPPRPEEAGLRGCPTLVQNVESLAQVAALFRHGPERVRAAGTRTCPGTALFTVTGAVDRPGVYEVPYGTRLSDLLRMAGAPPVDEILAVLPGGLGSGPLRPDELDVPLTYEDLAALGTTMGTSAVVVFRRDGASLPEVVRENVGLMAQASCGQCQGCKEGHLALARALEAGDMAEARRRAEVLLYGRGNCALPTGTARFALRALQSFPETEWQALRTRPEAVPRTQR
ncbi:NADH-quinone oxidoreductase subunit F [Symbiobacterium terraclitae]|uniref:NADH-quinone oxidoreductase subunit F n=2 Tax=Symbiobacterium terraclitae TaxID=557451 RepID=A0ABS4JZ51_9FIRM|nr:SLBB domain-containing protein [Symbiobacterium terraclitae]MBP2020146.1 NADH-quinone oxidoreductase subunit F [Symbiobacterium terraclitae]